MRLSLPYLLMLIGVGCHTTAYLPPQQPIPDDTLITIKRSICYGTCPDYTVTIAADGTVTFEGREFVKTKGVAKATITREALRQLIEAFENSKYFSLNDSYRTKKDGCPEVWTDADTVTTSIRINGKTKSISHYHGCEDDQGRSTYPKGLTQLEDQIDKIAGTKQWIE